MPPVVIAVAVAASYVAAYGLTVYTVLVAVAMIASAALSYFLTPKPKKPSFDSPDFSNSQGRTSQVRQPITPWAFCYGETAKSGPITYVESTNNNTYLHMVITLCSHSCEDITAVYFNEIPIYLDQLDANGNVTSGTYANHARIKFNKGTVGSQPFPDLTSESNGLWTNAHRQEGRSKVYVRLKFNRDVYNGVPSIKVRMKGKKVYDPRVAANIWTQNPTLIILDYLITAVAEGGVGAIYGDFDETNLIAAANTCEEIVDTLEVSNEVDSIETSDDLLVLDSEDGDILTIRTGDRVKLTTTGTAPSGITAGSNYYAIIVREKANSVRNTALKFASSYSDSLEGTATAISDSGSGTHTVIKTGEPRYTCNGVVVTDKPPIEILEDLRSCIAGRIIPIGGKWFIVPGEYLTPTISFDEDNFAGPIKVTTKHSRREKFNAVKGLYVTPATNDQTTNYPPVTNSVFETEDGNYRVFTELDLPFTDRPGTAQRIAKIELFRHRREITAEISLNLTGMQVQAGDFVMLSNTRLGWVNKIFEALTWRLEVKEEGLVIVMTLREVDSNVFDWDYSTDEQVVQPAPTSNLPTIGQPQPPTGLMLDSGENQLFVRSDGSVITRLKVSWTSPDDAFVTSGGRIEIQYKQSTNSDWNTWGNVPGEVTFTHILDVKDGVDYDVRVRSISHLGFRSEYLNEFNHTVIGKTSPPGDVETFTIEAAADGTRIYRWVDNDAPADVRAGGGYKIRYQSGLGGSDYDTMEDLHAGLIDDNPYESNELQAGDYTFAIKAVDNSGNYSTTAKFVDITLPDPRLGAALLRINEANEGWPGTITNGFVSASNVVYAEGSTSGEINDLPATINALSTTIIGMRTSKSPLTYITEEHDLGTSVTFRPLVTAEGNGTITASIAASDSTGYTGYSDIETTTARYFKIKVVSSGSSPEIDTLTYTIDAPTQEEQYEDVNTASTSNPSWFGSVTTGHFYIETKGGLAAISQAQISALQNTSGGWTWELTSKASTYSTAPAAEFKVYDSSNNLADAIVDVLLRGPRAGGVASTGTGGGIELGVPGTGMALTALSPEISGGFAVPLTSFDLTPSTGTAITALSTSDNTVISVPQSDFTFESFIPNVGSDQIPAVIYNGVTDYLKHSSGPSGASDGTTGTFVWVGQFNSNDSAMRLYDIPGTTPIVLERKSDNTLNFEVDSSGAICSAVTTAIGSSVGLVGVYASFSGTQARLYVTTSTGTITGTPSSGSTGSADLTADWYLGANGGASDFLDANTSMWWADDSYIDFSSTSNINEFWSSTAGLPRNPGANGSNYTGSQPLILHIDNALTHTSNDGSGGDADAGSISGNDTSPGEWAADVGEDPGLAVLATAEAWWAADDGSNTTTSGNMETLVDKSGNGNDLTQATAGNRPSVATDGDGNTYMDFDGTDDVLECTSPTAALMNNFDTGGTYVGVYDPDNAGENGSGRLWSKNSSFETFLVANGTGGVETRVRFDFATTDLEAATYENGTTDHGSGQKFIFTVRFDKSNGLISNLRMSINGVAMTSSGTGVNGMQQTLGPAAGASSDLSGNTFSYSNRSATDRSFDGKRYEDAIWDSDLSDSDLDDVVSYLASKYNITLS